MAYTLKDFEEYLRKINHGKYDNLENNIYPATAPKTPTYSDTVRPWDVENKENTFYTSEENSGTMEANQQLGVGDKTSVGNVAAPMSAPGAGANADTYDFTLTPEEQEKRRRLQEAQTKRNNLLANNVGMPTTEDVVKLGACDDEIKQLSQELGVGDKTGTQNVASPMSAPDTKPFVPTMTEPIQRYGQPEAVETEQNAGNTRNGSNGAGSAEPQDSTRVKENTATSPIVPVAGGLYYNTETGEVVDNYNYEGNEAAGSGNGGSKDHYINPDDYENSEDYAKAILEGVRNSIDAQDLDGYLTANGYAAGAEGLAALNKYVEGVLGALGVAVYTDELNAKEEETSGANGQPASSEPQEQAASSEPQAAQPASSDVPEYELYSPVEPELTPVEQIQQARWDALNRPFERMGVPVPEWEPVQNYSDAGAGASVPTYSGLGGSYSLSGNGLNGQDEEYLTAPGPQPGPSPAPQPTPEPVQETIPVPQPTPTPQGYSDDGAGGGFIEGIADTVEDSWNGFAGWVSGLFGNDGEGNENNNGGNYGGGMPGGSWGADAAVSYAKEESSGDNEIVDLIRNTDYYKNILNIFEQPVRRYPEIYEAEIDVDIITCDSFQLTGNEAYEVYQQAGFIYYQNGKKQNNLLSSVLGDAMQIPGVSTFFAAADYDSYDEPFWDSSFNGPLEGEYTISHFVMDADYDKIGQGGGDHLYFIGTVFWGPDTVELEDGSNVINPMNHITIKAVYKNEYLDQKNGGGY